MSHGDSSSEVEVPSAFAAIAIITLHPAVRDANGQAHSQEPHWASNLVSSVRGQKLPGPVPVCSGADSTRVQVVVPRARVVSAFKALVGLKRQLGFHTSKDDIALQPSRSDMQTAMTHMVLQMLEDQGWYSLQQGMLLKTPFLEPCQGSVTTCAYLSILDIAVQCQNLLLLTLQIGADASPAEWAHFNDEAWSLQITCRLLPDMTPAIVAGMQLVVEDEAELRKKWEAHHHLSLPAQIPCYYQVRVSTDPDEAAVAVPSCCVWSESGLTTVPHGKDRAAAELALRHVAGDLAKSSLCLWPGEQLSFGLLSPQDSAFQPSPAYTWQSAKEAPFQPGNPLSGLSPSSSFQPLQPVLDETLPVLPVRRNVTHLGADLSRLLLQLEPRAPDVVSSLSIPQMRASNQQLQLLPAQQPQPKQRVMPALRRPVGADMAKESQHEAGGRSIEMQLPRVFPAAPDPALEQSSRSSMLPCQVTSGTLETLPQKPVFAKHKRPGSHLTAKPPPESKASKKVKIKAAKTPAINPACAAAAPMPMPAASAAQDGAPTKPKAAQRAPPKASNLDHVQIEAKVKQMWADGLPAKLSVPEIKVFLKARKQPVGGRKADLLVRLNGVLSGTGATETK